MTYTETQEATDDRDVVAALKAGTALARPIAVDGAALAFAVPDGYNVLVEDTEQFAAAPRRKRGTAHPATVTSLIEYVQRHETNATTVWVHPDNGDIVAILDDHEAVADGPANQAGFGGHRARLSLEPTPEWNYWIGADGKSFDQVGFAEHIEDGSQEVVEPSPVTLLEIASTFQAKRDVNFRSAVRLKDGVQQFQYDEEVTAGAGTGGTIEIPDTFKLGISPFTGEPKYAVTARLRYRLSGGKLSLSYKLERPHDVIRDALDTIATRLGETFPNVYIGTPR